jgi:uncharacterized membrane protein
LQPPVALVACALLCLLGMELVYLKDPYGPDWYRMNTVFKLLSFVFLLLPVPTWRLLAATKVPFQLVVGAVPWLLSAPQLATVVAQVGPLPQSLGGLTWMAPGEAQAAHVLFTLRTPEVLVEGVGEAYSEAGRMASASGLPAVLGWENHQRLWRGESLEEELQRRREAVAALFSCQEASCVQRWAKSLQATLVVVGSVERRLYPHLNERAIAQAGQLLFARGGVMVVRVAEAHP